MPFFKVVEGKLLAFGIPGDGLVKYAKGGLGAAACEGNAGQKPAKEKRESVHG